ncbi:MAG: MarR family transcriptional regulator [Pseudomonadota bacterium]
MTRKKESSAAPDGNIPIAKTARGASRFALAQSTSRLELLDEDGKSDNAFRQFLYDFSVLASQLETARAYLASHIGVTAPQYNILMVIARRQGLEGISVSDVARFLHVSVAFVTTEARKLENIGLVEKRPNPNDARGTLLTLSPQGQASVREVEPERMFVNDHLFHSLSREDFQQMSHSMTAMLDDFANTIQMLQMRKDRDKRAQRTRERQLG